MMKKVTLVLFLTMLFFALTVPTSADGPEGDVVIWGDNYTLESGQRLRGDLLVYAGDVDLEPESQVDGNVTLFGGNLDIRGEIEGDVTVWGGNVNIRSSATIRGQVVSVGGNILREEGADVQGDEIEGFPFTPPKPPSAPTPPRVPQPSIREDWGNRWLKQVGNIFRSAFGMLVLIILGILVVVFIPGHTDTVAETIIKAPLQSFLSGLAAVIVVPLIALILTVTICLSPVAALLLLILGVAMLLGWIAAGLLLGVKVLRSLTKSEPNPVAAVALGVFILTLLSFTPCLGALITAVAVTWSVGAVAYSFFGTRAYNEPPPKFLRSTSQQYDPRMDQE